MKTNKKRGKAFIRAKALKDLIRKRPGLTMLELSQQTHWVMDSLAILQRHNQIKGQWVKGPDGRRAFCWFVVDEGGKAVGA